MWTNWLTSDFTAFSITLRRLGFNSHMSAEFKNDSMSNLATSTTVNRSNVWGGKLGLSRFVQRYSYLIFVGKSSCSTVLTLSMSSGPDSILGMLGCPADITCRLLNLCCSHFFPKVRGSIRRTGRVLISIVAYSNVRESLIVSFWGRKSLKKTFADFKSSLISLLKTS